MMHWHSLLLSYLWIAPHLLLAVVAVILWKRRVHTNFPVFVAYVWYEIAEFIVLFAISATEQHHQVWYFRIFLITLAISAALRFGVIQEVFNNIFQEQGKVDSFAKVSLRWTTGFLLLGAVLVSLSASGQSPHNLLAGAAWVSRGVAIVQCGLVLFLFLFSRLLGLSLQSYVFGIALGFGVLSSVELANSALRTGQLSASMARVVNLLPTGGYHIAVLIWLGYLIVPARKSIQPPDEPIIYDVRNWNNELERFLQ